MKNFEHFWYFTAVKYRENHTIFQISRWVFEINGHIYIPGRRGDSGASFWTRKFLKICLCLSLYMNIWKNNFSKKIWQWWTVVKISERFSIFFAKTITYPESRRFKLSFKLIKTLNCSLGLLMAIASTYPSKAQKWPSNDLEWPSNDLENFFDCTAC